MNKIPTIFKRDPENMRNILNEPHPNCEWVFNGEGIATRKYDGTCCAIIDGIFLKRREIKKGKAIPHEFILAGEDSITGKKVGWVPVVFSNKEDRWHIEAYNNLLKDNPVIPDGTFELLGPKIQGNPEGMKQHILFRHSMAEQYPDVPTDIDGLRDFLSDKGN